MVVDVVTIAGVTADRLGQPAVIGLTPALLGKPRGPVGSAPRAPATSAPGTWGSSRSCPRTVEVDHGSPPRRTTGSPYSSEVQQPHRRWTITGGLRPARSGVNDRHRPFCHKFGAKRSAETCPAPRRGSLRPPLRASRSGRCAVATRTLTPSAPAYISSYGGPGGRMVGRTRADPSRAKHVPKPTVPHGQQRPSSEHAATCRAARQACAHERGAGTPIPKLTVRVRFSSPAPHTRPGQGTHAPPGLRRCGGRTRPACQMRAKRGVSRSRPS